MNTDLPTPNIPLLRKAVEWAEAEAAKTDGTCMWRQETYARETDCGTAYCIAGYVVAISAIPGGEQVSNARGGVDLYINGQFTWWDEEAIRQLGLTLREADALFAGSNDITAVRRAAEQIAARAGERL